MTSGDVPTAPRPLGPEGSKLWGRVWALGCPWIDNESDLDHVALLCESMDERVMLRVNVLQQSGWRDRISLRQLDAQIAELMGQLGLNPTDRKSLIVRIVDEDAANQIVKGAEKDDHLPNAQSTLDELRARRNSRTN